MPMDLMIILGTIVAGFFVGRHLEKTHFKSIQEREKKIGHIPATTTKLFPGDDVIASQFATGSVVISIDAFKKLLANIVNIFGGEVHAYSSLIDRARREAILRMRESSPQAEAFYNLRVETATLSGKQQGNVGCVEVFAYATAVKFRKTES